MNEAETRAEHVNPALRAAALGVVEDGPIWREHLISPRRIANKLAMLDTLERSLLHQTFTGQL